MTRNLKTICITVIVLIAMLAPISAGAASAAVDNPTASIAGFTGSDGDIMLKKGNCPGQYVGNWNYYPGYGPCAGRFYRYPTFYIAGVVRNGSVTITTYDLPPQDRFDVMMNVMGTAGKCGIVVASINSGGGGTQTMTFNIPPALYGQFQISMRLQSTSGSGFYAYNWFYNNTAY